MITRSNTFSNERSRSFSPLRLCFLGSWCVPLLFSVLVQAAPFYTPPTEVAGQEHRSNSTLVEGKCNLVSLWSNPAIQAAAEPLLPPAFTVVSGYLNCMATNRQGAILETVHTVVGVDNTMIQLQFSCTPNDTMKVVRYGFPNATSLASTCRSCRNAPQACQGKRRK